MHSKNVALIVQFLLLNVILIQEKFIEDGVFYLILSTQFIVDLNKKIKPNCDSRLQRAFNACVFKEITLVGSNLRRPHYVTV